MAQHITKGHREIWIYHVGLLRKPEPEDELSSAESDVLDYLKKAGGYTDRGLMLAETNIKPETVRRLETQGLIWVHPTHMSTATLQKHGESVTVVPGVPVPDGPDRVTVTDEESYERALELIGRGPVLISTRSRTYQIDEFDQAAEIVSDQLVEHGYALVEAVKPKTVEKRKSTLDLPVPRVPGVENTVHVVDDRSFEKALELVTRGPVTITAKNLKYSNMDDFDKVAERLVYLLSVGYQPWVEAVKS